MNRFIALTFVTLLVLGPQVVLGCLCGHDAPTTKTSCCEKEKKNAKPENSHSPDECQCLSHAENDQSEIELGLVEDTRDCSAYFSISKRIKTQPETRHQAIDSQKTTSLRPPTLFLIHQSFLI